MTTAAFLQRLAAGVAAAGDPERAAGQSDVALACWGRPEREFQYAGTLRRLCTERAWWDTVDELATHVAGPLVAAHTGRRRVVARGRAAERSLFVNQ